MAKMTTEEAFVKVLQMHGIEKTFGIIGSAFMPVSDLFPTGQGNIIGNAIEPVIKLTANPKTATTMSEHIDLDVSKILKREMNLSQAGDALIDITVKTANGRITCAEALGHKEFIITKLYRSA